MSDSGSEMGADNLRQKLSDAASLRRTHSLTCTDVSRQRYRTDACLVRDEEAAGSNPAIPTQVTARFSSGGAGRTVSVRPWCAKALRMFVGQAQVHPRDPPVPGLGRRKR